MKTASQLRKFRQTCERSAGLPANQIELPLLGVLADVCSALKLSPRQSQKVLGRKGVTRLTNERDTRVQLTKPVIYQPKHGER